MQDLPGGAKLLHLYTYQAAEVKRNAHYKEIS